MGTARMPVGRKRSARRTSVADALFTKTQQRVLSLLFGDPDRQFFMRELIDQAGSGSGAVQRELARLADAGLVTMTTIGGRKHYQANRQAPVFEELRGLIMKTVALVDPLREALEPMRKEIDLAVVYGSVARGEAHAASDVDLLVVSDDLTLEKLFAKLARAEKRLGRKVQPTLYTSGEYAKRRRAGSPFLSKLLAGEHIVLLGAVDETRA